jgi:predicted DNA-binding transcriptional regulator AlpA
MSIKNLDPEALLTEEIAARLLSLSPRTLQTWRSEKRGPAFVRMGRSVRYRLRVLLQWIDDHTCSTT